MKKLAGLGRNAICPFLLMKKLAALGLMRHLGALVDDIFRRPFYASDR